MTPPDPVSDPRAFWASVAGLDPDQLIFPPGPSPLLRRWTRWCRKHPPLNTLTTRVLRLWRILWFGPHHPEPAPRPRTPLNLAPWTNQRLPHPAESTNRTPLKRLRDRILWQLSHPDTRFETHAWRCKTRADTPLVWRLGTLRNTLSGQPSGPPPERITDAAGKDSERAAS